MEMKEKKIESVQRWRRKEIINLKVHKDGNERKEN